MVEEWNTTFGTDAQMLLCSPEIAIGSVSSLTDDQCPCLGLFHECYIDPTSGRDFAMEWMESQIDVINTISTAQNKLSERQIYVLAADIFTQYFYWNLGDVCIFLGKVRRGQYGHFYGSVDNLLIMEWAREFDKERREELNKFEKAMEDKRKQEERKNTHTVSRDAYLESLSEEEKQNSSLYAIKTGKRKLFAHEPIIKRGPLTGTFRKPADLDSPPPLSEETIRRREEMIRQLEKEN